jgi:pimeloyl-ACP methyl ester carboxylesterase
MNETLTPGIGPDEIEIAYERRGDAADPAVLLVMGAGAQLVHWADEFCDALVARGLQVVRFDNRDAGRSTHMAAAPEPDVAAVMRGDLSSASYTLSDMAADAVGLLDALELPAAHVVGASMGGAIAQTMAIEHPGRVLSLTSIMSTTGDLSVGQPHPETLRALFGAPPAVTRDEVVARAVRVAAVVGSPGYPGEEPEIAARAGVAYDRGHDDVAMARHAVATVASGDRTPRLRELDLPALVIHGLDDRLFDPSGGRATAAAIPGAELMLVEGMGHSLPSALWPRFADAIAGVVERAR